MEILDLKAVDQGTLRAKLEGRNTLDFREYNEVVQEILDEVAKKGDEALLSYTEKFDGVKLTGEELLVKPEEFERAYEQVGMDFIKALRLAIENITAYHSRQKQNSWFISEQQGVFLGQKITSIARVGIYVPGGTAAYPSSVLMNAIPAQVAGVKKIVMMTPPLRDGSVNPNVLVAAKELGIEEIYKVGGAQAIGALAFGTNRIPKVNKIVGPGNIYVATAKRLVYGYVDIDMIAGPSEILVIADESANPRYVAADLLSQAEHDPLASAICITTSNMLAEKIKTEVIRQTEELERKKIIEASLKQFGQIIVVETLEQATTLANEIAPEHLELCVAQPFELVQSIENAGSIFLGHFAPESLGDYIAGPNHVLPTSGTAKFYSPLSVDDFIKKSSLLYYDRSALERVKDEVMTLAQVEGLTAHKNAVKVRFEEDEK